MRIHLIIFRRRESNTIRPHTRLPAAERDSEMGILDYLFGKKVEIELTDDDGKTVKRTVAKKELGRLVDKGPSVPMIVRHLPPLKLV